MMNDKNMTLPASGPFPKQKNLGTKKFGPKAHTKDFINLVGKQPSSNQIKSSTTPVFFNTCFDKNHLKTVIAWFLEHYGEKKTIDLVETLKQVGFHQATRAGVSLGVDDLQIPPQKATLLSQALQNMDIANHAIETGNVTSVEKSQRLIDTWNQTSETLRQKAVHNFRTRNPVNPVYMMAFSGARGNISQVRQLVAMRGLMADPQGAILEFPIQSNFREGLTVTEYLISCYGARKGLVDTALRTATSGYLTRRLVDAVQHVVVHVIDCQTKKGIVLKDKNLEQRLLGRVVLEDLVLNPKTIIRKNTLISQRLAKLIVTKHKEIRVRSPLTCQTEKSVCQLCYGLDLGQGKLVSIGEAVGIIAGQSIGEPGTQLTMRTFHTGGVGVFSDQALTSFTAPFDGKVEFLEALPGLFVRTPHGNIVYLLKHKVLDETKPILRLPPFSNTENLSTYEIFYSDVPTGSLLWVKQGEQVKTGQLLIQASRLQTTTQQMPESSHPVHAPLSGEIFFELMVLREEERFLRKGKYKKEKVISPIIPTLRKLGNFWLFSCFLQNECQFSSSFFRKGDLVSNDTPIQQWNFHIAKKGQLKKLNSTLLFGSYLTESLFEKIHYSSSFYFFVDGKNTQNVLSYTTTLNSTLLTWYPVVPNLPARVSCYSSVLGSISFWSLHKVYETQPTLTNLFCFSSKRGESSSFFLFTKGVIFSKKGLFQFVPQQPSLWCSKTPSQASFAKNSFNSNSGVSLERQKRILKPKSFHKRQLPQTELTPFPKNSVFGRGTHTVGLKNTVFGKGRGTNSVFEKGKEGKSQKTENFLKLKTSWYKESSTFLKNSLEHFEKAPPTQPKPKLIKKQHVWFCVPKKQVSHHVNFERTRVILQPGKKIEELSFENSYTSLNLVQNKKILIVKAKPNSNFLFYSKEEVLNTKNSFNTKSFYCIDQKQNGSQPENLRKENLEVQRTKLSLTHFENTSFPRQQTKDFCFYKKQVKLQLEKFLFFLKLKKPFSHVFLFQKLSQQELPEKQSLKQNWLSHQKPKSMEHVSFKSPLFTKQKKTIFSSKEKPRVDFQLVIPKVSGWVSSSTFLKVEMKFNPLQTFGKIHQFKQHRSLGHARKSSSITVPGFSIFLYRKVKLENTTQLGLQTFENGLILPYLPFTQAFLKSKKLGEFRGFQKKEKEICLSILEKKDVNVFEFPIITNKKETTSFKSSIGNRLRQGYEISLGYSIPVSGQILKITDNKLTLRKGVPFLASIRGLVHISQSDLVKKNDLLITLRSRRLQTEDIVQGIPKIEQLFEARETKGGEILQNNMHILLAKFFQRAQRIRPINEAVTISLSYIQHFLVSNILQAYSNQGVDIAEKHVEVVVRQMTARVRILSPGQTGFLPGELVQIRLIEQLNQKFAERGWRQATYQPVILGITKSVLQSESFLLAASFQQVSKVLVRSALAKKTDFLRGLHENILVGQPIPAGTGLIQSSSEKTEEKNELEALDPDSSQNLGPILPKGEN